MSAAKAVVRGSAALLNANFKLHWEGDLPAPDASGAGDDANHVEAGDSDACFKAVAINGHGW